MVKDAGFHDVTEQPLRLTAMDEDDLAVISALTQDALGKVARVQWAPRRRRFSALLYRFRWEDAERAEREHRAFERVASALTVDDVIRVRSTGIGQTDRDAVFSVLGLQFTPDEDGQGTLRIHCSAGCALEFDVECLNITLTDLTRPWAAAGQPQHFD